MAPCEEVEVDMENRLAGSGISVIYNPVAFLGHPFFSSEPGSNLKDMADEVIVLWYESERAGNMFSWHDEKVHRRNRRDVFDCNHEIILIDFFGGNFISYYFAEDAIIHWFSLLLAVLTRRTRFVATIHHLYSSHNP